MAARASSNATPEPTTAARSALLQADGHGMQKSTSAAAARQEPWAHTIRVPALHLRRGEPRTLVWRGKQNRDGGHCCMSEPSTLSFTLTYAATLGVALLFFLAQIIAMSALLALAGIGSAAPNDRPSRWRMCLSTALAQLGKQRCRQRVDPRPVAVTRGTRSRDREQGFPDCVASPRDLNGSRNEIWSPWAASRAKTAHPIETFRRDPNRSFPDL